MSSETMPALLSFKYFIDATSKGPYATIKVPLFR